MFGAAGHDPFEGVHDSLVGARPHGNAGVFQGVSQPQCRRAIDASGVPVAVSSAMAWSRSAMCVVSAAVWRRQPTGGVTPQMSGMGYADGPRHSLPGRGW